MREFFEALYILAIDMGFYMIIGLLLVTIFNVLIKKEWIATHLGKGNLWSIIKASIFGVPLPLCSCGVVPTGLYLKDKGASDASTASFLISTPQTGVDSIAATYGLMGITFAWFRPIAAFISGVFGGLMVRVFGKSSITIKNEEVHNHDDDCLDSSCNNTHSHKHSDEENKSYVQKLKSSFVYAFGDFVGDNPFAIRDNAIGIDEVEQIYIGAPTIIMTSMASIPDERPISTKKLAGIKTVINAATIKPSIK